MIVSGLKKNPPAWSFHVRDVSATHGSSLLGRVWNGRSSKLLRWNTKTTEAFLLIYVCKELHCDPIIAEYLWKDVFFFLVRYCRYIFKFSSCFVSSAVEDQIVTVSGEAASFSLTDRKTERRPSTYRSALTFIVPTLCNSQNYLFTHSVFIFFSPFRVYLNCSLLNFCVQRHRTMLCCLQQVLVLLSWQT